MRILILLLISTSVYAGEVDKTISKQRLYRISCERGFMSFFMEHGNGSASNKEFYQNIKQICQEFQVNVSLAQWNAMTSPSESGCSTAVKALAETNQGTPELASLYGSYCAN